MSEKNDFGAFVMGFTLGALAGAVVSLIMAPQTGEDTRQMIKEKAIELKDKGNETFEETKRKAEVAYKDALTKAEELSAVTKQKAVDLAAAAKEKAASVTRSAKVKLDQAVEEVEKAAEEIAPSEEPKE